MQITNREGVACETQLWVLGRFGRAEREGRGGCPQLRGSPRVSHPVATAIAVHRAAWSGAFSCQKGFFWVTGSR